MDNGRQVRRVSVLAMAAPTSVDWCGYWQRAGAAWAPRPGRAIIEVTMRSEAESSEIDSCHAILYSRVLREWEMAVYDDPRI
jgi:hypothetical protein